MRGMIATSYMEFGWMCSVWAPILRARSRFFEDSVILCNEQYAYLFEDFGAHIYPLGKAGSPDRWLVSGSEVKVPTRLQIAYPDHKPYHPTRKRIYKAPKEFFSYGERQDSSAYDLVIHARAEVKYGQNVWNWKMKNYVKTLKRLGNIRACSVGTRAMYIPGTDDQRGIPLSNLCNIFKSSKVAFGPSSGPLHLAMHCECPVVVMTEDKYQKSIKGTNRDRYKRKWNPFAVEAKVLDKHNWHPPVELVADVLKRYVCG